MTKTILIVDDQLSIREMLQEILRSAGYGIVLCESGEEALSHISEADILITDFQMGGMSGAGLAKQAKRQKPKMPVIIMTGTPRTLPNDHAADFVLEKPFTVKELLSRLADVSQ